MSLVICFIFPLVEPAPLAYPKIPSKGCVPSKQCRWNVSRLLLSCRLVLSKLSLTISGQQNRRETQDTPLPQLLGKIVNSPESTELPSSLLTKKIIGNINVCGSNKSVFLLSDLIGSSHLRF